MLPLQLTTATVRPLIDDEKKKKELQYITSAMLEFKWKWTHVQLGSLADPLGDHLGLEALVREIEHVWADQNAAGLSGVFPAALRARRHALPLGCAARRHVQEHWSAGQLECLRGARAPEPENVYYGYLIQV